jgi:hypothetical protein
MGAGASARAAGPVAFEVAALGAAATSTVVGPDATGAGVGARAGVVVGGFYGGLVGEYFFGGALDTPLPGGESWHQRATSELLGAEGGYDLRLGRLSIRPEVGVGYYERELTITVPADFTGPIPPPGVSRSVFVEPAVAALFTFSGAEDGVGVARAPALQLGVQAGGLLAPSVANAQAAACARAEVGVRF